MKFYIGLCSVLIAAMSLLACASSPTGFVNGPDGGAAVIIQKPIWLPGIEDPVNLNFTQTYPPPEKSTHIEVVSASIVLANAYGKKSQLIYEFSVNLKDLPNDRVYTRMVFDNPESPGAPFIYEHYFDKTSGSTKGNHGPLKNLVMGAEYHMIFEIYQDEERTKLIDKVNQILVSAADNTSGCVKLDSDYKQTYFGALPGPDGILSLDQIVIFCDK